MREVREGFKGCTLPYSFENRVLFVREGEFNPPDLIKPKRVEAPHRLPGERKGSKEQQRVEAAMRHLGYKIGEWDTSIPAHNVDHAFQKAMRTPAANLSYNDWRNQQVRNANMRSSMRRQELVRRVMDTALLRLRDTWFCREDPLKRKWDELVKNGCIKEVIPLHHAQSRTWLQKNWANVGVLSAAFFTASSPVNDLCAYYGEEVAFFFAFVEHYNRWLILPAFFGTIIFMYQVSMEPETLDSDALVTYMILISGWATIFLEVWARKQNVLAHLWGVMHIETEDTVRSQFKGETRYNHWISGYESDETKDSFRKRPWSIVNLIFWLGLLFAFQINMTLYKSAFKDDVGDNPGWFGGGVLSISIVTITMQEIFAASYEAVAKWLTRQENFKTESAHTAALGLKLIAFQIANYYLVLMLTAFYGENGTPCIVSSHDKLLFEQCTELEITGYEIPEPGCLAIITPRSEGGVSKVQKERLQSFIDQTVRGMTADEMRNSAYKCINGTTMKDLFLTFFALFIFRLMVGLFRHAVWAPLKTKARLAEEDLKMRASLKSKAIERLTRAKLFINQNHNDAVQKIQDSAPVSKQDMLSKKLAAVASSEEEERNRIFELTRSRGIFGFFQKVKNWLEERKRLRLGEQEAAEAAQHMVIGAIPSHEGLPALDISPQEKMKNEMEKALRTISFDHSEPGRESKRSHHNTFHEFNRVVVQFGYIGYFSGAFPAATLLAWLYNINEVRIEARKMVNYCKRPLVFRVKRVLVWVTALNFVAYTGMIVNILMLGLSSFSLRKLLQQTETDSTFTYFPHLHERGSVDLSANIVEEETSGAAGSALSKPVQKEWGMLSEMSDRGRDFEGRVEMLWCMIAMEHALFFVKLLVATVISDVPGWVKEAQMGIKQFRRKKELEKAFQFNDEDDSGLDVGIISGAMAVDLKSAIEQANIDKTMLEMELPPKERAAKPQRILSLESILLRQLKVDERGLPLMLDEAVQKHNKQVVATESAKRNLASGKSGSVREQDIAFHQKASDLVRTPLAEVTVHVVEAVRPHTFQIETLADDNFLYVTLSIASQEEYAGTTARTAMCEARPNLSFAPVSVEVYHYPAELKVELLSWAGAGAAPRTVAATSVFVTASPFDVDSSSFTIRLDTPQDHWYAFPIALHIYKSPVFSSVRCPDNNGLQVVSRVGHRI